MCVFLKSGGFFFSLILIFKAANYVCVNQSFLLPLGKDINTVTLAESSASRQRKWFLPLFPCVVLHQLVGSYGWAGGLWRPLRYVPLCVQSLSASPLFSSPIPLLRPAAAGGPKREPSRESHSTEGAAFSLLLALAVGNEVQGELLLPPLLICQGCVLLGS